jgi:sulfur carrier protein
MNINISVNGSAKEIDKGTTLDVLIKSLVEKDQGIIVELNEKIITRNDWKEQPLNQGDVIQLISFVGGG